VFLNEENFDKRRHQPLTLINLWVRRYCLYVRTASLVTAARCTINIRRLPIHIHHVPNLITCGTRGSLGEGTMFIDVGTPLLLTGPLHWEIVNFDCVYCIFL